MILASGDKVFSERGSLVGSVGCSMKVFYAGKLLDNLGVKAKAVTTDE
jgi:ClpP class serine protease